MLYNVRICVFFSKASIIPVYVYSTFSLSILAHFCHLHLSLAFLNNAAMNLPVQICLAHLTLNSFGYIFSSGMARSYNNTI